MKFHRMTVLFLVCLLMLAFSACTDSEKDEDGDNSEDGDTPPDGDADEDLTFEPCATGDLGSMMEDHSFVRSVEEDCYERWYYYAGAPESCYAEVPGSSNRGGDGTKGRCSAQTFSIEGVGETAGKRYGVICEACCGDCGSGPPESGLNWPGPGFGCFLLPIGTLAVTGWHNLGVAPEPMMEEGGCLRAWTEESLAFILDRNRRDETPCEGITDLRQCLGTHNPPAHCTTILGWPVDMLEEDCTFNAFERLQSQAALERAEFLGCHTVYEHLGDTDPGSPYVGLIRRNADGHCLHVVLRESRIPEGWSKTDCASCRP